MSTGIEKGTPALPPIGNVPGSAVPTPADFEQSLEQVRTQYAFKDEPWRPGATQSDVPPEKFAKLKPLRQTLGERGLLGPGGRGVATYVVIDAFRQRGLDTLTHQDVAELKKDTGIDLDIDHNPAHRVIADEYTQNLGNSQLGRLYRAPMTQDEARDIVRYRLNELDTLQAQGSDDPTMKPDGKPELPGAPIEQRGYAFVTNTEEEAELVSSMIARRESPSKIQEALLQLRANKAQGLRQAAIVKPDDPFPSHTLPTGPVGGKPFGEPETIRPSASPGDKRGIRAQNAALDRLADAGYRVVRNPKVTKGPDGKPVLTEAMQTKLGLKSEKNPDALIEGRVFDVYAPSSSNVRHIYDEIGDKSQRSQAHRVVLNLQDSEVSARELRQELNGMPITNLKEIILIDRNGIISHFFPFKD